MGAKTKIEWTDATWNPTVGCTSVSPGCDNCYARSVTERFHGPGSFDTMVLHPERLELPLRWRRPRMIFVNSMSDLFHEAVPDDFIARVFGTMASAAAHTYQVLTKRHARMRSLLSSDDFRDAVQEHWADLLTVGPSRVQQLWSWPLPNVWLGVSTEDQHWADIRIPVLLDTPTAVHFISAEPLLGPLVLRADWGLDWVIVGGESGPKARPMRPHWVRDIKEQCKLSGTPFLFKQWGEFAPARNGEAWQVGEEFWPVWRYGKKAAGRELDGQLHDGYPEVVDAR